MKKNENEKDSIAPSDVKGQAWRINGEAEKNIDSQSSISNTK